VIKIKPKWEKYKVIKPQRGIRYLTKKKKKKLGVQKRPDGQRGGYSQPKFFLKYFIKKKKNCGQYGKFWIQLIKLQKFGTLRGRVDCKN
jgi:hypothetical protein